MQHTFNDKILRCCDCGESFQFTAGESAFYYSKSLSEPKRCKPCRELRRRTLLTDQGVSNDKNG